MAVTQNTYTGNGATNNFSFTFPYLDVADIKVSLDGVLTTEYSLANATTVQLNTAPANGVVVRIYRQTDDTNLAAQFYPGSAIRSQDLNDNFTQNLYVTQESNREAEIANNTSDAATALANTALSTSQSALTTAQTAESNSNTAVSDASAAVSTANTASSDASAAVNTANAASATADSAAADAATAISTANSARATALSAGEGAAVANYTANLASTNASEALSTANTASTDASNALTAANNAVTTANTADTNASDAVTTANAASATATTAAADAATAVTTANTASTNASSAVTTADAAAADAATALSTANTALSTANTALTDSSTALTTANTASTNASSAVTTANSADSKADQAIAAVANSLLFTIVTDVAAIPGSPSDGDAVEVTDSTGIESFTPLASLPSGFVGDSGLGVRIVYNAAGSTWSYLQYFPQDPDNRYAGPNTDTGSAASPSIAFGPTDSNSGIYSPGADQVAISTGGTEKLRITSDGKLGLGTSSPFYRFHAVSSDQQVAQFESSDAIVFANLKASGTSKVPQIGAAGDNLILRTDYNERLRITSDGKLGIGTTAPSRSLEVKGDTNGAIRLTDGDTSGYTDIIQDFSTTRFINSGGGGFRWLDSINDERARIDSSGRLLVGTSTTDTTYNDAATFVPQVQLRGASGNTSGFSLTRTDGNGPRIWLQAGSSGSNAANGALLGSVVFSGYDGANYRNGARIESFVDGTSGSGDMPGRLVFSTTPSGSATPQERLRITSDGNVGIGTTSPTAPLAFGKTDYAEPTSEDFYRIKFEDLGGITDDTGIGQSASGNLDFNAITGFRFIRGASGEVARIDSAGRLLLGSSVHRDGQLQVESANATRIGVVGNSNLSTQAPVLSLLRARGGTVGSNGDVVNNDYLGEIDFRGRFNGSWTSAAKISCQITDNPVQGGRGGNYMPGKLIFYTNGGNGGAALSSTGFGVGTIEPDALLHVASAVEGTLLKFDVNTTNYPVLNVNLLASSKTAEIEYEGTSSLAGNIAFKTNGSEVARIDSSGRLLVGTSSAPSAGDGQYSRIVAQGYTGLATGHGYMSLARGQAATSIVSGDEIGTIAFTDSAGYSFARIGCTADAAAGNNDYPGRLTFSTTADGASSPTERVRISNTGEFSQFGNNYGVIARVGVAASTNFELFYGAHSATSTQSGTGCFRVASNGNVQNTNNSYGSLSDIKLKENIVDASSQWADIKALRPVNYNFKAETGHETFTQLGLIAQEVELVSPGLVLASPDRDEEGNDLGTVTKSVNYSVLYMKAVKALQEAMERIETLEASNADLLARVSALESA